MSAAQNPSATQAPSAAQNPSAAQDPSAGQDSHSALLIKWMGPTDANNAGFVHGGTVMRLCDEAAGVAATRHARQRVVTASVDRMNFRSPVHVGELLILSARVNAAWRSSMEVGVRVIAENPLTGERRHTSSAYLTMVAVDEAGHPISVPPIEPLDATDQRRLREAQVRREHRLAERQAIERGRGDGA